jgi:hypothetical protein
MGLKYSQGRVRGSAETSMVIYGRGWVRGCMGRVSGGIIIPRQPG